MWLEVTGEVPEQWLTHTVLLKGSSNGILSSSRHPFARAVSIP